eukprot:m.244628 g.244628  ORF g.244628 m.244628 type:complete len:605 (+) comp33833_c0_seq2:113-1927(+)
MHQSLFVFFLLATTPNYVAAQCDESQWNEWIPGGTSVESKVADYFESKSGISEECCFTDPVAYNGVLTKHSFTFGSQVNFVTHMDGIYSGVQASTSVSQIAFEKASCTCEVDDAEAFTIQAPIPIKVILDFATQPSSPGTAISEQTVEACVTTGENSTKDILSALNSLTNGSTCLVGLMVNSELNEADSLRFVPLFSSTIKVIYNPTKIANNVPFLYAFTLKFGIAQLAALLCGSFVAGIIMWMMERGKNPQFDRGLKGLFTGFYWGVITFTSVGYGDVHPKSPEGRILAVFWSTSSTLQVALMTTLMLTDLTSLTSMNAEETLSSEVNPAMEIGALVGTSSMEYAPRLTSDGQQGVKKYHKFEDACTGLIKGHIQAFIADENVLQACFVIWSNSSVISQNVVIGDLNNVRQETYGAIFNPSVAGCNLSSSDISITSFLTDMGNTLTSKLSDTFVVANYSAVQQGTVVPITAPIYFSGEIIAITAFCLGLTIIILPTFIIVLMRVIRLSMKKEKRKNVHLRKAISEMFDYAGEQTGEGKNKTIQSESFNGKGNPYGELTSSLSVDEVIDANNDSIKMLHKQHEEEMQNLLQQNTQQLRQAMAHR